MLSRGYCYEPNCKTRVIRWVDEQWRISVFIAHIYGLKPTSARHDPAKKKPFLNSFRNLILLCMEHHNMVDGPGWKNFSPDLLQVWKKSREGDAADELDKLDWLNQQRLQDLMAEAITDTRDELSSAIDRVADVSQGTQDLLKRLLDESFQLPYLDADMVASLESSARVFRGLPDYVPSLRASTRELSNLPDYATLLLAAARDLQNLPTYVDQLHSAAELLRRLQGRYVDFGDVLGARTETLREAVRQAQVERLIDSMQDMNRMVGQVNGASRSLAGRADLVEAMERASENLAAAAAATAEARVPVSRRWSWASFWWGFTMCIVFTITVLALWARTKNPGT